MTRKAAKTGPGAMVLVAIEQGFPQKERIIDDRLAYPILPLGSRVWVRLISPVRNWIVAKTEEKVPGLWGGIMGRKRFIDGRVSYGHEFLYEKMRVKDAIWHYGIDPETIDSFLGEHGWRVLEHLGYDELGERYVKPTGRDLSWMAIERIVDAEKI